MSEHLAKIAYNGPVIQYFIVIAYILFNFDNDFKLLLLFLTVGVANGKLNELIKITLKQSRPTGSIDVFETKEYNKEEPHYYGMPSGHMQNGSYSYFIGIRIIKNMYYIIFGGILMIMTFIQRYTYKKHTILQLIIGTMIGFFIAELTIKINQHIK